MRVKPGDVVAQQWGTPRATRRMKWDWIGVAALQSGTFEKK
jgi:hypothetical protein